MGRFLVAMGLAALALAVMAVLTVVWASRECYRSGCEPLPITGPLRCE